MLHQFVALPILWNEVPLKFEQLPPYWDFKEPWSPGSLSDHWRRHWLLLSSCLFPSVPLSFMFPMLFYFLKKNVLAIVHCLELLGVMRHINLNNYYILEKLTAVP